VWLGDLNREKGLYQKLTAREAGLNRGYTIFYISFKNHVLRAWSGIKGNAAEVIIPGLE
jgi:hypothetical protein